MFLDINKAHKDALKEFRDAVLGPKPTPKRKRQGEKIELLDEETVPAVEEAAPQAAAEAAPVPPPKAKRRKGEAVVLLDEDEETAPEAVAAPAPVPASKPQRLKGLGALAHFQIPTPESDPSA